MKDDSVKNKINFKSKDVNKDENITNNKILINSIK